MTTLPSSTLEYFAKFVEKHEHCQCPIGTTSRDVLDLGYEPDYPTIYMPTWDLNKLVELGLMINVVYGFGAAYVPAPMVDQPQPLLAKPSAMPLAIPASRPATIAVDFVQQLAQALNGANYADKQALFAEWDSLHADFDGKEDYRNRDAQAHLCCEVCGAAICFGQPYYRTLGGKVLHKYRTTCEAITFPATRQTGLVASKRIGKDWQPSGHNLEIPLELGKEMMPSQLHGEEVKKPFWVTHPHAVKLADAKSWWSPDAPLLSPLANRRSADKSKRHPLAQQWRDDRANSQPVLLLSAGAPVMVPAMAEPEAKLAATLPGSREEFAALIATPTDAPFPMPDCLPRIRKAPIASLPKQNLDPFAQAIVTKRMKTNTSTAFSLANSISNDANAAHKWLREVFGINPNSLITDDQLRAVHEAVITEQLKYANKGTVAAIQAWGMAIHGGNRWYTLATDDTMKRSGNRTRFMQRLYQIEADLWLRDLRNQATPEQAIDAGRRVNKLSDGAGQFASNARSH